MSFRGSHRERSAVKLCRCKQVVRLRASFTYWPLGRSLLQLFAIWERERESANKTVGQKTKSLCQVNSKGEGELPKVKNRKYESFGTALESAHQRL